MTNLKFDEEKVRLELVPPEFMMACGRGLTFGAKKYSPGNWAQEPGFDHSRLYGALMRHLSAYWSGEDNDPESGLSHLDHAACMLSFLIASVERGIGLDDRIKIGASHGTSNGIQGAGEIRNCYSNETKSDPSFWPRINIRSDGTAYIS